MTIDDWKAKSREDEGGAEEDREDDEEEDHSFHLRDGDCTGLKSVGLASMLVRVGTFEGIAEFIAQVTEDLKAEGGEESEDEGVWCMVYGVGGTIR